MLRLSQLDYRQRKVNLAALSVDNDLHALLSHRATESSLPTLLTFNHPPKLLGQVDASEILLDGKPVDTWMARVHREVLRQFGIQVAADELQSLGQALVSSYLLFSSACVVFYKSQRGPGYMLVTKNADIVNALPLSPTFRKKGLKGFDVQFGTSYEELRTGSFHGVSLFADVDGVRLGKVKVSARSAQHVIPYHLVDAYMCRLVRWLRQHQVLLTFRSDTGAPTQIRTTLIDDIVAKWLGTTSDEALSRTRSDILDPASFGFISLPVLDEHGRFVSVPVLGIEQLQPSDRK